MSKVSVLTKAILAAGKSGDRDLAAKLTKELKAEVEKGVVKSKKLVTDIQALKAKLKHD